jgi:alkylresorcinol/alkylpyrone synthase
MHRVTGAGLMTNPTMLLSLATAVPPHVLRQEEVTDVVGEFFAGTFGGTRLRQVFASTGISKRHAVRPMDWYLVPRGWPERTEAYLDGAGELFVEAALKALHTAGILACEVDTIVTASSTGVATPSLEARVSDRLGFRPDVSRVPVFGLGCAAGVTGLALASRLARADPGSVVLFVAVELCTLAFRLDKPSPANVISTALFADGAAAAVVRTGHTGLAEIEGAGEHTWPNTLDVMGWETDPEGLGVVLARDVPTFAGQNLGPAVLGILERIGIAPSSVDRFVCHPGGTKVVAAIERALGLGQGSLDHEREVLAQYGNMSAPTALFVLQRAIDAGLPNRSILTAMGPGFTATCLSLASTA